MRRSVALLLGFCLSLLLPSAAASQSSAYTYKEIAYPDALLTSVEGINDRSQIVGFFEDRNVRSHGFLLSEGEFTVIDVPGALGTRLHGINNRGQMVGIYMAEAGITLGFLWDRGHVTTIAPPGSTYTAPYDINDGGQIVGGYGSASQQHSFLWTHGQLIAIGRATITGSAQGINQWGQLVMVESANEMPALANETSFRVEPGGALREIQLAGASETIATGINDRSEIVGSWRSPTGILRGFLLAFGLFTPINVPGTGLTRATDVNNRGQIVGGTQTFFGPVSIVKGFLATPGGIVEDVSGDPSPSGTRIPVATFIVDGDLATWTLGPGQEILRDGVQVANGFGSQVLWYQGAIYVLADDYQWWKWADDTWNFAGPSDPSL